MSKVSHIENSAAPEPDGAQQDSISRLTRICKAAADPLRMNILKVLQAESFSVQELCSIFELAQPNLSHHLKVLAQAGLVSTRKEGNSIYYRRPLLDMKGTLSSFTQHFFGTIDQLSPDRALPERIERIKLARAQSSLDFFAKNATKFSEQQALIVEHSQYAANVRELIESTSPSAQETALEIGPGEGGYLEELALQFNRVYALDNSRQMLEVAQRQTSQLALKNIEFILADATGPKPPDIAVDLAICDMVLHHIASPADVFRYATAILNRGGHLLIAELCPHHQDWVRDSCGDIWLGFEPTEIKHWAELAGLTLQQDLYLGLRNGFQIQLQLFQKPSNQQ